MSGNVSSGPTVQGWATIDTIRVGVRHRKDLGDLDGLCQSISSVGLLHPLVLTPDGLLVAGQRRLEACRRLGWSEVPVSFVASLGDASSLLQAERDENSCRKPMTASEFYALGMALEQLERPKARSRQGSRNDLASTSASTDVEVESGRTYEVVATAIGMSSPQWQRLKHIGALASEGNTRATATLALIDDGEETISGGYRKLRKDTNPKTTKLPESKRAEQIEELASQGHVVTQIAESLGIGEQRIREIAKRHDVQLPDSAIGKRRRINSDRIVAETVSSLEGLAIGIELIDPKDIDPVEAGSWAESINAVLASFKKLARTLREVSNG
jgi:hypothetical protein